jgi:hypothetical protein
VRTVVRGAVAAAALALGIGSWTPYAASGSWTATLGQTPLQFSYARQIEGSTVHVGAVAVPPTVDGDGVQLDAVVRQAQVDPIDCGSSYDTTTSTAPRGLIGTQVIAGNDDECTDADRISITVSRYSSSSTGDLPVAIKVVEEAPVADAEGPPEETPELAYDELEPGDPVAGPAGAAGFDDAPVVDARADDVTIGTEVAEGDELLWRVPLEWGDQLVVGATLPTVSPEEAERLDFPSVGVRLRIVQPSRESFALAGAEDYTESSYGGEDPTPMVAATYPLRYANRYFDAAPTLPGDHWVSVAVQQADEGREPLQVPVELTFSVRPTDVPTPVYKDAVLAQGGGDGPDGYSPETPYLVGDGEFSAVASGNPFTPESDEDDWWGPRRGVGLGVGVVSLACCAVGAVWLTRRRAR